MNEFISNDCYFEIASHCEQMELDAIWFCLDGEVNDFTNRIDAFFWIIRRLIKEGKMKIVKFGEPSSPIQGDLDLIIEKFRQIFPKKEVEMQDGLWFLTQCPFGGAWQNQ